MTTFNVYVVFAYLNINPLTPPRVPEQISANPSQCWASRHTWARIHFRFGKIPIICQDICHPL